MFTITGADSPTNLTAERVNSTSIRISWIPPASGPAVTGYRIYYQTEGDQRNVGVNATEFTITSLTTSDAYNISVVALSEHLPSAVVGLEIIMPGTGGRGGREVLILMWRGKPHNMVQKKYKQSPWGPENVNLECILGMT